MDSSTVPMRREMSHRKAKGRSIAALMHKENDDDLEEPPEFADNDEDNDWTPNELKETNDDEDDMPRRRTGRRGRQPNAMKPKKAKGAGDFYAADSNNGSQSQTTSLSYSSPQQQNFSNASNGSGDQLTMMDSVQNADEFKSGDFVVSQLELFQEWPPLWRVDGKTLLQKFEPFSSNNKTIYRSISTYATWTPENRRLYVLAKCKFISQFQHEMHVELLRDELCQDTSELFIDKMVQEMVTYQDNFEVYIQTLISQALDANFLTEISQEQDVYFLSNVKTVDDLTAARKARLIRTTNWSRRMVQSMETWPCYSVLTELGMMNTNQILCAGCSQRGIASRMILYGQAYNPNTIEAIQPDNRITYEKDLLLCQSCMQRCELFHKLSHQKYSMYIECAKKVAGKNVQDPMKATTAILNELLADEVWLAQLFKNVRTTWAEVDQLERQLRCNQ